MREIKIEKITLNIGAGKDELMLKKGIMLLKKLTGIEPVKTITQKRIPAWSLRPGLAVGCKITLRGDEAHKLLKRLLDAKDNVLKDTQFDPQGNFSFGIPEYVDITGIDYDPEIKIMGLECAVTLERAGFHIKKRRLVKGIISSRHMIKQQESMEFMQKKFGVKILEGRSEE